MQSFSHLAFSWTDNRLDISITYAPSIQLFIYASIHPSIDSGFWGSSIHTALIYSYVRLLQCSLVYIHYGNGTRCVHSGRNSDEHKQELK